MHLNSLNIMKSFVQRYLKDEKLKVLDLGSRVVGGQQDLGSYKPFFTNPKWTYIGADIEKGDNVDFVVEPYDFPFEDEEFDVVISGQTIEHMEYPWEWFKEVARVLKEGGLTCIIAPAVWHEHRYPIDTYRYYPDGMKALAKWSGLQVVEVKRVRTPTYAEDTYLIAKKP